jgi:hypothetical protein
MLTRDLIEQCDKWAARLSILGGLVIGHILIHWNG